MQVGRISRKFYKDYFDEMEIMHAKQWNLLAHGFAAMVNSSFFEQKMFGE